MSASDARLLIICRQRIRELQLETTQLRRALDVEADNHDAAMTHLADMLVKYIRWHDAVWRHEPPRNNGILRRLDLTFGIHRAEDGA